MNRVNRGCRIPSLARCMRPNWVLWILMVGVMAIAGNGSLWAHVDPPGCDSTGVSVTLTVLRNDGVTPVGVGTVNECETVKYRATLSHPGGTVCAFSMGTWSITTPNGVVHDVTPLGGIPCLGGTGGEGCVLGVNSLTSALVSYTASPADSAGDGDFDALTSYLGGTAHQSENNQLGVVSGSTGLTNTPFFCNDNLFCNGAETCNPSLPFGALNSRLGTCVPGSTQCVDNLFCSNVTCNEATDSCVTTDVSTTQCPDNLFCGNVACSEASDSCVTTDVSTTQCPDNLFCGNVACSEASDSCVTTDVSTTQCPDNLFCGNVACSEASDSCVTTDVSTTQCPDNLFCGNVACSEASDSCVTTDVSTTQCPDNLFCGNVACSEASDSCVTTDISMTQCPDNLFCSTVVCSEASDSCVTTDISDQQCPDDPGNVCEENTCDEAVNQCVLVPVPDPPAECLEPAACRMTGGHNFDVVDATFNENGKVYTTGGQIGAPNESGCCDFPPKGKCVEGTCTGGLNGGLACSSNDQCPNDPGRNSHCPWGDWEHNHHSGPDDSNSVTGGKFAFHSGTAAAPNEAFIKSVLCADPGWCVQARPAPFKQIYWEGTGVFHNAKGPKGTDVALPIFGECGANQPTPYSNKADGTLHYYKAHVSDFGEPAGRFQKPIAGCQKDESCTDREPNQSVEISDCALGDVCLVDAIDDPVKTALHPLCMAQTCSECPDEYEIEIHCTADPASPVAYRVSHEIREGNFQLHPPVGDSCNFSCGDGVCETGLDGSQETCATCAEDCCQ